jgi:putative endonuclease
MIGWLRRPRYWRHVRGRLNEERAVRHLRALGFRILSRNFQCAAGEIDLVAERRGAVHFVEVKSRRVESFGSPEESVDPRKQRRARHVAEAYLRRFPVRPAEVSFDVVGIGLDETGREVDIRWLPGVF